MKITKFFLIVGMFFGLPLVCDDVAVVQNLMNELLGSNQVVVINEVQDSKDALKNFTRIAEYEGTHYCSLCVTHTLTLLTKNITTYDGLFLFLLFTKRFIANVKAKRQQSLVCLHKEFEIVFQAVFDIGLVSLREAFASGDWRDNRNFVLPENFAELIVLINLMHAKVLRQRKALNYCYCSGLIFFDCCKPAKKGILGWCKDFFLP